MKPLERVMLIDDDVFTNTYNQLMFNKLKATKDIVTFQNGNDAISYLKNHNYVDLILLDINMPLIDGWEFLEVYKHLEDNLKKNIDIVMLSSSVNIDDEIKALGYDSVKKFINKPITEKTITNILNLVHNN